MKIVPSATQKIAPTRSTRSSRTCLRDVAITRANQAWCADVTYIPMCRGFLYLVAIMDWHSRKLWRSQKYENVYLNAYETGTEARKSLEAWIDCYNARRPHLSVADLFPDEVHCGQPGPPTLQDKNTEAG